MSELKDEHVVVADRFTETSWERKIGNGPWVPVDLSIYGGKPPVVVFDESRNILKE